MAPIAPDQPLFDDPRVLFAAERTFLAWIRTGLALMGFGFVVARFGLFLREITVLRGVPADTHAEPQLSLYMGVALVLLGVLVHIFAAIRHRQTVRRLAATAPSDRRWSQGILLLAAILAFIGLALAGYLLIWR